MQPGRRGAAPLFEGATGAAPSRCGNGTETVGGDTACQASRTLGIAGESRSTTNLEMRMKPQQCTNPSGDSPVDVPNAHRVRMAATHGLLKVLAWVGLALAAVPASASYTCSATTGVFDVVNSVNKFQNTPCNAIAGPPPSYIGSVILAGSSFARDGWLGAAWVGIDADPTTAGFVSGAGQSAIHDRVVVSGLGAGGADLSFVVQVTSSGRASASPSTQVSAPTAGSSFEARANLSNLSRVSGDSDLVNGCVKNVDPGISICNGTFSRGLPAQSLSNEVDLITLAIHVENDDVFDIDLFASASGLIKLPASSDNGRTDAGVAMRWLGMRFTDASEGVKLISDSGFDYRFAAPDPNAAVPVPATAALMLLGLVALGASARRRQRVVV